MGYDQSCHREIQALVKTLPDEQIRHMGHVGLLVGSFMRNLYVQGHVAVAEGTLALQLYEQAAFYHDIGKAMVPRAILTKAGRLTEPEYTAIRRHPLYASQILSKCDAAVMQGMPAGLLPTIYDAAVFHHEWWNGKGYPYGLQGSAIPYVARVTAICDAFEAMTGDRVYRKALAPDKAIGEIAANSGTQFDPALAQAFIANEADYIRLVRRWQGAAAQES